MGIKISELQEKTTANDTDIIPIVDTGTKKITKANLLKEIKEKATKKVLWENDNIIVDFAGQTITLSSDDYDYLMIFYYRNPSNRVETKGAIVEKNKTTELQYFDFFSNNVRAWSRTAQVNKSTVIFSDSTINGGIQNHTLIPYKIIGCKY